MLPITFFLCGSITMFHSGDFPFIIYTLPPTKMTVIHTLRFCLCPMNNEIRKVHLLSIPSKNLSEWSKFCRLIGRKNLGSPYMETCHPWGEGVRIKTRTSHCLISPKGTLYFTFDHQVFLHSTKLCPTPPAASPHNS